MAVLVTVVMTRTGQKPCDGGAGVPATRGGGTGCRRDTVPEGRHPIPSAAARARTRPACELWSLLKGERRTVCHVSSHLWISALDRDNHVRKLLL